jgi:hypothetical protein
MTATEAVTQTTHEAQRDQRTGRMLPAAVAVAGLWLATALSSLFAPDLISASQDHVPIVAITIWIWGAVATGFVVFGARLPGPRPDGSVGPARGRAGHLGIWGTVALVSIFAPTIVAGSDGTIVPIAGLFAPVAGAIATGYACLAAAWSAVSERRP